MLWNCGTGEDFWESLEQQGDQTSQSYRKSTLNSHWKDWCWSWNSNSLATWWETWLIWKDPDAGKDWKQEEKGTTEDEMVRYHHWYNRHELELTLGDSRDREAWRAAVHEAAKSQTRLSDWTDLKVKNRKLSIGNWEWYIILFYSTWERRKLGVYLGPGSALKAEKILNNVTLEEISWE